MTTRRTITLEIAEKDFDFTLGAAEVTKYFNAMKIGRASCRERV